MRKLIDKYDFNGHFSVNTYKDGILIDNYEDKNLIVDKGRVNMAHLLAGSTTGFGVNRLVIGTRGSKNENILSPIEVNENGFNASRELLFSQDDVNNNFFYTILWDYKNPTGINLQDNNASGSEFSTIGWNNEGTIFTCYGKGNRKYENGEIESENSENMPCPIVITINDKIVTFKITIPEDGGNGATSDDIVAYTEAGLFCGEKMLSMKCLPARVKDSSVVLEINWSIVL